jgi:hypothetical protein
VVVALTPVSTLVAVMVAFGTVAPLESTTLPITLPLTAWPKLSGARASSNNRLAPTVRVRIILPVKSFDIDETPQARGEPKRSTPENQSFTVRNCPTILFGVRSYTDFSRK